MSKSLSHLDDRLVAIVYQSLLSSSALPFRLVLPHHEEGPGISTIVWRSSAEVLKGLHAAEMHFVECEDYENAARARDKTLYWKSISDDIYIK